MWKALLSAKVHLRGEDNDSPGVLGGGVPHQSYSWAVSEGPSQSQQKFINKFCDVDLGT